ncbi:MAG: DUF503 domain-containing protein [Candidatus Omnitrophica bacterium]|nr:DUF503 domain-containing protein [Candidatus Omnitrophota bacterium]
MTIAVLQMQIFIPAATSLKGKRKVIKSIKDKIRAKFNVSVAEVDGLDKWQRATLAIACVNRDRRLPNSILSKIVNLVEAEHAIELIDYEIELY